MKNETSDTLNVTRRKAIILSGSAAAAGLSLGAAFYLFQNKKEKVETKIDRPDDASGSNFVDEKYKSVLENLKNLAKILME